MAAQKLIFDLKLGRLEHTNKFVCLPAQTTSPSMFKVGEKEGMDLLFQEMEEAGIDQIVVPGRNIANPPKAVLQKTDVNNINVTDQELIQLRHDFDNRSIGLHGINVEQPIEQVVADIETAVNDHNLAGAVLEIGYSKAPDGGPLSIDNQILYPIYETIVKLDVLLMIQSGIYAGHDIGANDWPPLDKVMQDFSEMKLVLAHGGYPRVLDAIALAVKHQNFYISPDIYCFFPGGKLYVEAISQLPDQFLFGTAYPFGPMKMSVDMALEFPLSDRDMEKYMSGNAARLLNI